MRTFITLDEHGNVKTFVRTGGVPGASEEIPDGQIEVTNQTDRDWLLYRWTGSQYIKRTDLGAGETS